MITMTRVFAVASVFCERGPGEGSLVVVGGTQAPFIARPRGARAYTFVPNGTKQSLVCERNPSPRNRGRRSRFAGFASNRKYQAVDSRRDDAPLAASD
ncbi:hypothetical protein EYF80_065443 [Liparis tanakae]|uniref:Uncharacterized protein n=1 Tax=Liparis tanakae TaxID=230148 RepID=A0A4Z2E7Z4_9TELE|nr:hypothetical protein EYF80_065443 [Liparis tanakae]